MCGCFELDFRLDDPIRIETRPRGAKRRGMIFNNSIGCATERTLFAQLHNARWYDPATARWLSEDPSGFDGGDANLYRYAGNSALNFTDPTGLRQAGNPLANLPGLGSPAPSLTTKPFANLASLPSTPSRSVSTPSRPPSFTDFVGPVRPTPVPLGDSSFINASNINQYVDNSRKVVSVEQVGGAVLGNSVRSQANDLAGRIENLTTTGHTGPLGTSLAVYGALEAHAVRLVGSAAGGVVDVPGTTRAAIDDLRTTKRVYDQYGTATAAARQIGLLQGAEAYYGTDVLTYETVDPFAKLSEASGRFGGTAGTAAGIGSGVTRFLTPDVPAAVPRVHGNSLDYVGDTHVYAIGGPEGSYKIGQSMQGVRKSDGASIRGEAQVRALRKQTGQPFESEIRKNFLNKASALDYETRLIERFRSRFGDDTLPGNKTNR
jgi:RHS repeat-associated protein